MHSKPRDAAEMRNGAWLDGISVRRASCCDNMRAGEPARSPRGCAGEPARFPRGRAPESPPASHGGALGSPPTPRGGALFNKRTSWDSNLGRKGFTRKDLKRGRPTSAGNRHRHCNGHVSNGRLAQAPECSDPPTLNSLDV